MRAIKDPREKKSLQHRGRDGRFSSLQKLLAAKHKKIPLTRSGKKLLGVRPDGNEHIVILERKSKINGFVTFGNKSASQQIFQASNRSTLREKASRQSQKYSHTEASHRSLAVTVACTKLHIFDAWPLPQPDFSKVKMPLRENLRKLAAFGHQFPVIVAGSIHLIKKVFN